MTCVTVAARAFLAFFLLAAPAARAAADEVITYRYDALGRLVATSTTGCANNGLGTAIGYDAAGNRQNYTVTGAGAAGCGGGGGAPIVADGSFEVPPQNGGFTYGPSVAGVVFSGGAGVAANGSAWHFAGAPDGAQVGFLQNQAAIAMTVSGLTAGATYTVRFSIAQRPGYTANPVDVSFGGTVIGHFTPASTDFTQVSASFIANGPAAPSPFQLHTRRLQTTSTRVSTPSPSFPAQRRRPPSPTALSRRRRRGAGAMSTIPPRRG